MDGQVGKTDGTMLDLWAGLMLLEDAYESNACCWLEAHNGG